MSAKVYFFRSGQSNYVRYDVATDKVDDGYPLDIGDFWPGMRDAGFATALGAAVDWGNGKIYFFKDSKYVRYDVAADKVDKGYPLEIGDTWHGMREAGFAAGIGAAANWGNGKVYFFKDSKYVRYDVAADKVDDGYPLEIGDFWPGMRDAGFGAGIGSAVNWGNGKVYFFKGSKYVRYDVAADKVDDGYPLEIGDFWPGMRAAGFGADIKAGTTLTGAARATPLTGDLPEGFFKSLRDMCVRLKCRPICLLLVMNAESGVRARALHPNGGAAGINQLTTDILPGVGWNQGPAEFAKLSAEQQLPYVEKYFKPRVGMDLDSTGRLYQANFLPATLSPGQGPETVLAERDGVHADAYAGNIILDQDHDGRITIADLEARALSLREDPRWKEIESRL